MIRKGLIYSTITLMILLLVSLAIAAIPPPPVDQNMGIYDRVFTGFTTDECKECHTGNLVSRHHTLYVIGEYGCMDCHGIIGEDNEYNLSAFRECSDCHLSSPHHATDDAQDLNCSACHGSLVDDEGDGHVIPTYDQSDITPDTSFTFINGSGVKIGGCEACHEPSGDINSNPDTHHNLYGFTNHSCNVCHSSASSTGTPGEGEVGLDIRYCEKCHGIKSLHNIQYDYNNTKGSLGYGHIGDDWDCLGCHGYSELYESSSLDDVQSNVASLASSGGYPTGPINPTIYTVSPSEVTEGLEMVIIIEGDNFENTINDILYTSKVILDNDLVLVELDPDYITPTEIRVTILGTLEPGNYRLTVLKDGSQSSNPKLLVVESAEQLYIVVPNLAGN